MYPRQTTLPPGFSDPIIYLKQILKYAILCGAMGTLIVLAIHVSLLSQIYNGTLPSQTNASDIYIRTGVSVAFGLIVFVSYFAYRRDQITVSARMIVYSAQLIPFLIVFASAKTLGIYDASFELTFVSLVLAAIFLNGREVVLIAMADTLGILGIYLASMSGLVNAVYLPSVTGVTMTLICLVAITATLAVTARQVSVQSGHLFTQARRLWQSERKLLEYQNQLEEMVAERTRELNIERDRANDANRAKSAFLANMSHELRTPLNAILGFAQVMSQTEGRDHEDKKHLEIIDRSGELLLRLINHVLDMSKIEAGKAELDAKPFLLQNLLETIEPMFVQKALAKGLDFQIMTTDGVPAQVLADQQKLSQILINLLSNAIKFTNSGRVDLEVDFNSEESKLCFIVSDTGMGVPADQMERLFQPFERVDGEHRRYQGTGLGLPISLEYARLMNGDLTASSVFGEGTQMMLTLPYKTTVASSKKDSLDNCETVELAAADQPCKVLIAEDNSANQFLLVHILQTAKFEVEVAQNGIEAVEKERSFRPDFIFMDLRMPMMDGIEATSSIRQVNPTIPIVALTASIINQDRAGLVDQGFTDLLAKPFRTQELLGCIAEYLGLSLIDSSSNTRLDASAELVEESTVEPVEPVAQAAAFEALPMALRKAFVDALASLDLDQMTQMLADIQIHDPALGHYIGEAVNNFQFDLLNALVANMIPASAGDLA